MILVISRITTPKDSLISEACEYATLDGERDFRDVIKLRISR